MPTETTSAQSARGHLATVARNYPNAWNLTAEYRAERGQQYPSWPEWCFLPIAAAIGIVADKHNADIMRLTPIQIGDAAPIAALAAWRMTQGSYRYDPALYADLIETPVSGDLPASILLKMPEWCVYIETPGLHIESSPSLEIVGAWCHLEYDIETARQELRLVLNTADSQSPLLPIAIHVVGGLSEGLNAMIDTARANASALRGTSKPDISALSNAARPLRAAVEPIVSLLLYLCTESADITRGGRPETPHNPTPVKTRRQGDKLFPADSVRQWDVGVRIGAALRAAYQREQTGGDAAPTGRTMRPHVRRAHWHTILSGPRLMSDGTPIPSADRRADLRWMPPVPVNVADIEALPTTIRKVGTPKP